MASSMKGFEPLEIPLEEIKSATNNFSEANEIGSGAFGKVYRGLLSHSHSEGKRLVAIKRLDRRHGQGDREFYKEVRMLSCYRHENIISLLGFSRGQNEMILVYEYASRSSLDGYLKDVNLTWTQRLKICLDAAKGLCYLHDPRETHQRLIHCDIKSANILLDDNFSAKVADFGLSKIAPANPQNSTLITVVSGTPGYCDPEYVKACTVTKESDVYSFGVVLFEVLCGKQCIEVSNGKLKILAPIWKKSFEEKQLSKIVIQDLMEPVNQNSLETFADIAYKCLNSSPKERPAMSLVVERLETALQMQILPEEYVEIAKAAVDPLLYKSFEEFKQLLTKGVLLNRGKMLLSLNKEQHHVMVSIDEYLSLDDPNRDYSDRYWSKEKSRFEVGCYKTSLMKFKLHVTAPLFLTPGITYGVYLVFQHGIRVGMKQQHVGIRYKFQEEKTISIVHFADEENKGLVAELYRFTSNKESILELEIFLEDCGLSGDFYIEGIQFRPLEEETRVARQGVIANQEIVGGVVPPLFYKLSEESELLLSQGILLNGGKTWLSKNSEREFCVVLSIEDCLIRDEGNRKDSDRYTLEKDSRFAVGCYRAYSMDFKIRVRTPFILSPHVTYGINLIFQCTNIEYMELRSFPIWYKLNGEILVSIVHLADQREDGWLVAELYQSTYDNDKSIPDLEIIFEKCWFSGYFHVEGIEFHPLRRVEHALVAVGYEDIHKVAVTPLCYTSTDELKLLLTRGILLNGCQKWLYMNEKEEHIERIYIEACLNPAENEDDRLQHPCDDIVNSRFPGGLCYKMYCDTFKPRVRGEYLTPELSYTVNLVFRYRWQRDVNSYNPLRYKVDGKDVTKVFITYPIDMRQDGWFIAPLYQFTSQHKTADLQFEFEYRVTPLLVAGIEFQPYEEKVELPVFEEYKDIIEAASQSLFYTSLEELKQILSKGVHLNGYKTWFSLNEKGEHCEMISMKDCLIPNEDSTPRYQSHCWSRFLEGFYQTNKKGFKTRVKTQFLSPSITYTVNLVFFDHSLSYRHYIELNYTLREETTTSIVYRARPRKDDKLNMAELYQFTSDGSIFELEITFDNHGSYLQVEGILFKPLEK